MNIKEATPSDIHLLTELTLLLYKNHTFEDLFEENSALLSDPSQVFLLAIHDGTPVGFTHCAIRTDYVEGTNGGNIGYLEGIFVLPEYRKKGIARKLLLACEHWAREKGGLMFASDCEFHNEDSYHFHLAVGFHEANRIICFTKKID